jgi:hypothetical protein
MHTKTTIGIVASAVLFTASAQAFAQTAPAAPAGAVAPQATAAASAAPPAAPPAASAAAGDPNIDRGFLQPTAMTQPAGTLTYNNYELLLHGLTYGLTDNAQVSLTVLSPIVQDMPFFAMGSVKWRVLSRGRVHLAVQGSAGYLNESSGLLSGELYLLGAGGFATVCLREDCSSLASVNATYELVAPSGLDQAAHLLVYSGSVVHRVSPHVKLLAELTSEAVGTSFGGLDAASAALFGYGVRFHTADVAADVGFVLPIGIDSPFLMGLPFVSVSYRW